MNKERRKRIEEVRQTLAELREELAEIHDEEQEAYDNLPEGLQEGERGEAPTFTLTRHLGVELCRKISKRSGASQTQS